MGFMGISGLIRNQGGGPQLQGMSGDFTWMVFIFLHLYLEENSIILTTKLGNLRILTSVGF